MKIHNIEQLSPEWFAIRKGTDRSILANAEQFDKLTKILSNTVIAIVKADGGEDV